LRTDMEGQSKLQKTQARELALTKKARALDKVSAVTFSHSRPTHSHLTLTLLLHRSALTKNRVPRLRALHAAHPCLSF